jgi:hypothetical protein
MSNDAPFPNYPAFDPVSETRLLENGYPGSKLSFEQRTLRAMAHQNYGTSPPPGTVLIHLAAALDKYSYSEQDALRRAAYVASCYRRYGRGVPINSVILEETKTKISERAEALQGVLPREIINAQGVIDLDCLEQFLPERTKRDWSRSAAGTLRVDTSTLTALDNDYSNMILDIKEVRRAAILFNLGVDPDGRHRAWPNPFGTSTGRENPKGWSFSHLPKYHKNIIQPPSGKLVAQLDYRQQELTILGARAENADLLEICANGDLYEHLGQQGPWEELSRDQVKRMTIALLYGGNEKLLARMFHLPQPTALEWFTSFKTLFHPEFSWLDQYAYQAYHDGRVSSLDWGMAVTTKAPIRSIKNWPIQAAGADILRRACLCLDDAQIPVVGCIHDAILIEIDEAHQDALINRAQKLMAEASAEVLNGVRLQTSVELYNSDATDSEVP